MSDEQKSYIPISRRRSSPRRHSSPIVPVITEIYHPERSHRRNILQPDIINIVRQFYDYENPALGLVLDADPLGVVERGIPTGPADLQDYTNEELMQYLYLSIENGSLRRAATLMMYFISQNIIINPEVVELLVGQVNRRESPELASLLVVSTISGSDIPINAIQNPDIAEEVAEMGEQARPNNIVLPGTLAYRYLLESGLLPRPPRPRRSRRRTTGYQPRNTLGL